jgi:hypothetical protein
MATCAMTRWCVSALVFTKGKQQECSPFTSGADFLDFERDTLAFLPCRAPQPPAAG